MSPVLKLALPVLILVAIALIAIIIVTSLLLTFGAPVSIDLPALKVIGTPLLLFTLLFARLELLRLRAYVMKQVTR
jgi:hypothetical protein